MIRQLSGTIILPITGLVLTFAMCYGLIQLPIGRNNLHDVDIWAFFKRIFKISCAVLILSNIFSVVMAMLDLSQYVVQQSAGPVQGSTKIPPDMLADLEMQLGATESGPLLGLWLQFFFVGFTMTALNIVIFVITYERMIEIHLMTSLTPIPFTTVVNREVGSMGQDYFRPLLIIDSQGPLIIVCIAIYMVLIQGVVISGDMIDTIWGCVGYTVLLCFTLFKTGSLAKSVFGAY